MTLKNRMGMMAALALAMSGPNPMSAMTSTEPRVNPTTNPRYNGREKISPTECFISVGPGPIVDGLYYACLMTPIENVTEDTKVIDRNDQFATIARMKRGYASMGRAIDAAAKTMTAVPVLMPEGGYSYPYFKTLSRHAENAIRQAEERRQRRAAKRARQK